MNIRTHSSIVALVSLGCGILIGLFVATSFPSSINSSYLQSNSLNFERTIPGTAIVVSGAQKEGFPPELTVFNVRGAQDETRALGDYTPDSWLGNNSFAVLKEGKKTVVVQVVGAYSDDKRQLVNVKYLIF